MSKYRIFLSFILLLINVLNNVKFHVEGRRVCYGKYGCFSDDPPFNSDYSVLPLSPEVVSTKFILFTRDNRNEDGKIFQALDLKSLRNAAFKEVNKTVLIIHGFLESGFKSWIKTFSDALLTKEDVANVISVDWSFGASAVQTYPQAAANTRIVGAQVEELISWFSEMTNLTADSFHIIGSSLGAHVAGYVGRRLREKGMILRRITGLDPAGPGFNNVDPALRLDASDASFVDVIHTDIDGVGIGGFGIARASGHVDFYPNGGDDQPMCTSYVKAVKDIAKGNYNKVIGCSHNRAIYLFIHSITNQCELLSYPCESWEEFEKGKCSQCNGRCTEMGYNADKYSDKKGKFYLETSGQAPFCLLEYKVTIYASLPKRRLVSFLKPKIKLQLLGKQGDSDVVTITRTKSDKESFVLKTSPIGQLKHVRLWYRGFQSTHFRKVQIMTSQKKNQSFCARLGTTFKPSFSYKSTVSPLVQGIQC